MAFTVLALQQSCTSEPEGDLEVSYKNDLVPITQTSCVGYCHHSYDHYSIYENIKAVVDDGQLWEKLIVTKEMPLYPGNITEEQRALFASWIEAGAPDN